MRTIPPISPITHPQQEQKPPSFTYFSCKPPIHAINSTFRASKRPTLQQLKTSDILVSMSKSKKKDASSKWVYNLRSRFIVFDGPDGSGKSTQFRRFSDFVHDNGIETCEVREPGGSPIGEKIREILLDPANDEMVLRCEMLLYMASRAQLAEECIKPAMMDGQLILVDRFISSTLAYQAQQADSTPPTSWPSANSHSKTYGPTSPSSSMSMNSPHNTD